jgi:hypothetical protein
MATPIVSGTAALIRDYYMQGFYPSGTKVTAAAFTPSGALIKATLINSAMPMIGAQNKDSSITPITEFDFNQGFGRIQILSALKLANANSISTYIADGVTYKLAQGASKVFTFTVDKTTCAATDFTTSLVWTDPADQSTNLNCAKCVFNNLDLTLTRSSTGNQVYYANGLSSRDTINNAEKIRLTSLVQGEVITVTVVATSLTSGSAQKFALVASGCFVSGGTTTKFPTAAPISSSPTVVPTSSPTTRAPTKLPTASPVTSSPSLIVSKTFKLIMTRSK